MECLSVLSVIGPITNGIANCFNVGSSMNPTDARENLRALDESLNRLRALREDVKVRVGSSQPLNQVSAWFKNVANVEKEIEKMREKKGFCVMYCTARKVEKKLERVRALCDQGKFDQVVHNRDSSEETSRSASIAPAAAAGGCGGDGRGGTAGGISFVGINNADNVGTIKQNNQLHLNQ